MKKIAMLICAAALTVGGCLNAQAPVDTVNVKFASPVVVGNKTLPAGACTIHIMRSNNSVVLSVQSQNGESSSILVNRIYTSSPVEGSKADVVLERHGDTLHFGRLLLPDNSGYSALDAE
jgi:hypothetical protein